MLSTKVDVRKLQEATSRQAKIDKNNQIATKIQNLELAVFEQAWRGDLYDTIGLKECHGPCDPRVALRSTRPCWKACNPVRSWWGSGYWCCFWVERKKINGLRNETFNSRLREIGVENSDFQWQRRALLANRRDGGHESVSHWSVAELVGLAVSGLPPSVGDKSVSGLENRSKHSIFSGNFRGDRPLCHDQQFECCCFLLLDVCRSGEDLRNPWDWSLDVANVNLASGAYLIVMQLFLTALVTVIDLAVQLAGRSEKLLQTVVPNRSYSSSWHF